MAFTDPDPVECDMGLRLEDMSPDQIVAYIKTYHQAFGLTLAVEGVQERAIFQAMQKIYGRQDAGRIIKWVFYKHKGRHGGRPVRFTDFCKARKWWVDMMHVEMQQHLRVSESRRVRSVTSGAREVQI